MENEKIYHIETLGCQMNERDSETIAGMLESLDYRSAESESFDTSQADVIVINTCSVRENADNRFFGMLGRVKHLKEKKPATVVAVCGCMMQQQHIIDKLRGSYGWIDIVFGTHNIHEFPRLLENVRTEHRKVMEVQSEHGEIVEGLPSKRAYPWKAFVNIMYGCNNFCTYCIVPYTRGRERSRKPEDILREVAALCADGVKEITLLGQNVNSYLGVCENGREIDFPSLLGQLSAVQDLRRLRFMTSHPKDLSNELVQAFAEYQTLCPCIHLPVQAGSNRTLARMNRNYTRETYFDLVDRLRKVRPGIAITTDLIVGFPGETEEDFEETMRLIERVRFDSAFTFLYSPRLGTPAADYADQIPEDIKHARFNRMVERLNAITLEINEGYMGKTLPVLIEGRSKTKDDMLFGRTDTGKLVNIHTSDHTLSGTIQTVEIVSVNTFSFTGEIHGRS
jgi:tRNA-2-methylthio-N6-dimethylallyladenosine synthase